MPLWGGSWGTTWGPLAFEISGADEGAETIQVDDDSNIVLSDLFKIFVGPDRVYTTIQQALDELAANLITLAISPLDVTRIICIDPKDTPYVENVVIPASIIPTSTARLIITCSAFEDRTDPRQVVVDGGGAGDVFLVQNPFVTIGCLTIQNGDRGIRVTSDGDETHILRNIIKDHNEHAVACESGGNAPLIATNSMHGVPDRIVEILSNTGTARVQYNSILADGGSLGTPSECVHVEATDLDHRNNIEVARGTDAVSRTLNYDDDSGANTLISDFNNLFRIDDPAGPLAQLNSVDFVGLAAWQAAPGAPDPSSISDDPDFADLDTGEIRLRLRLDTPSHRAGTFIADLLVDLFGGFRPQDLPSQGAIEPMNVILDQGKVRVLELLGGISTNAVDRVFAGQDGTIAAMPDSPEATDRANVALDDKIFQIGIPIERIRLQSGVPGKVLFGVFLGPTAKLMAERLDQVVDPLSEIGLAFADDLLFTRLTVRDTPLEPLMPVTSHFDIGVEFV